MHLSVSHGASQNPDPNRGVQRENCVDLTLASSEFLNFCGHKQRTLFHYAFTRERSAAAVYEIATKFAAPETGTHPFRHPEAARVTTTTMASPSSAFSTSESRQAKQAAKKKK